jgi:EAL domain-containing protein (putative c-di-GMP-specific phosphodiesterase class I)
MRKEAISRLEFEEDLHNAINNNELELYYQPIMDLKEGKIVALEALVRWNHPRYGQLLPESFISIAEETDLILPIGQWILITACSQMKKWHDQFPFASDISINVNISGKQFNQTNFVDLVIDAIKQTGINAESVALEITESVLIDNYLEQSKKIQDLNETGTKLQLDDFGTGYSSLAYIQHIPAHIIKIDQSFIRELGLKKSATSLINTIITMAHSMGKFVIAEGIETEEQFKELISLSCKFGQGFYLSLPLNVSSLNSLFQQHDI